MKVQQEISEEKPVNDWFWLHFFISTMFGWGYGFRWGHLRWSWLGLSHLVDVWITQSGSTADMPSPWTQDLVCLCLCVMYKMYGKWWGACVKDLWLPGVLWQIQVDNWRNSQISFLVISSRSIIRCAGGTEQVRVDRLSWSSCDMETMLGGYVTDMQTGNQKCASWIQITDQWHVTRSKTGPGLFMAQTQHILVCIIYLFFFLPQVEYHAYNLTCAHFCTASFLIHQLILIHLAQSKTGDLDAVSKTWILWPVHELESMRQDFC